jgi:molecular chaperone GrpE
MDNKKNSLHKEKVSQNEHKLLETTEQKLIECSDCKDKEQNLIEAIAQHDKTSKDLETINQLLQTKEQEITSLQDQLLRSAAEMENLKKRMYKQIDDTKDYAITGFVKELIPIMDYLVRTIENIPHQEVENNNTLKHINDGINLTKNELEKIFNKNNIQKISPAIGSTFDHNSQQAVAHVPSKDHEDNTIISLMETGYYIKDRLLRPALVSVAKKIHEE